MQETLGITGVASAGPEIGLAPSRRGGRAWWVRLLCIGTVIGYVVFTLSPVFRAKFWESDDHETVRMIGLQHHIALNRLPTILKYSIQEPYGRFRPMYWFLRVMEAFVWEARPMPWYVTQVGLAVISTLGMYVAAQCLVGPVGGGVAALLYFAASHTEIWGRLGPAEAYANPFLTWGLWLVVRAVAKERYRPWSQLGGVLLMLVAALCKESFVAVPTAVMGLYVLWPVWARVGWIPAGQRRWRGKDWCAAGLGLAGIVSDVAATQYKVKTYGHVYSGQLSWEHALNWLRYAYGFMTTEGAWYVLPAVAVAVVVVTRPKSGGRVVGGLRDVGLMALALVGAALLLFPPQMVFYGSSAMLALRYLLPGYLFVPACVVAGFWVIRGRVGAGAWRAIAYAPAVLWTGLVLASNGQMLHARYGQWALRTRDWDRRVKLVAEMAGRHPEMPILFHIDSVDYFEPVIGAAEFVEFYLPNPTGRIFLQVDGKRSLGHFDAALQAALMGYLHKMSEGGGFAFSPLSKLRPGRAIHALYMTSEGVPEGPMTVFMQPFSSRGMRSGAQWGEWNSSKGLDAAGTPTGEFVGPGAMRWGYEPGTRLTVSSNGKREYRLEVEGAGVVDGQGVTVLVDGVAVEQFALGEATVFTSHATPLGQLGRGNHEIEIRYGRGSPTSAPAAEAHVKAVQYRKLLLVRVPPAATKPAAGTD